MKKGEVLLVNEIHRTLLDSNILNTREKVGPDNIHIDKEKTSDKKRYKLAHKVV